MPDGVLLWFDDRDGSAIVVHNGRRYPITTSEIDTHARHAGARVHFDIERDGGLERATNVTLRGGRRTGSNHRRVADLAGARRPDTKGASPFAVPHPEIGRDLATRPFEVARRLATHLAADDLGSALLLYAPDATVHVGAEVHIGLDAVRRALEELDFVGRRDPASVHGDGATDEVVLRWPREPGHQPLVSSIRVRHGLVIEQQVRLHRVIERPQETAPLSVSVVSSHDIDGDDVSRAVDVVHGAATLAAAPVLRAVVRLTLARDRALERPAAASATLDVNGTVVRASVTAPTVNEAVDLLKYRLHERITRLLRHGDHERMTRPPADGEWRHGAPTTARPGWFERPPDERRVVRRKTYEPEEATLDEALFDLEVLDHDFHLFRDLGTGQPAVVARNDEGYVLTRLAASDVPVVASAAVTLDPTNSPRLTLADAVERLNASGERFVFFHGPDAPDGALLYRRYDGHYGLVEPAPAAAQVGA